MSLFPSHFNPRARVGHDIMFSCYFHFTRFQSTCPRGARLPLHADRASGTPISIHVPAWGTTKSSVRRIRTTEFQSTCPRGARLSVASATNSRAGNFNPRARVGHDCRPGRLGTCSRRFQSTCPRGARLDINSDATRISNFNPRARVGHDRVCGVGDAGVLVFQSTCPRGARRGGEGRTARASRYFNPRARVGHDFCHQILVG